MKRLRLHSQASITISSPHGLTTQLDWICYNDKFYFHFDTFFPLQLSLYPLTPCIIYCTQQVANVIR